MRRSVWIVSALAVMAAIIFAAGYALQVEKWVGSTNLEVEFFVFDAESGKPVSDAVIEVVAEPIGGATDESQKQRFTMVTSESGRVRRELPYTRCVGTYGVFVNTFVVYLPQWTYRGSAVGYEPGLRTQLDSEQRRKSVERLPDCRSKLVVLIPLQRRNR